MLVPIKLELKQRANGIKQTLKQSNSNHCKNKEIVSNNRVVEHTMHLSQTLTSGALSSAVRAILP
jgi:hypothetical protein